MADVPGWRSSADDGSNLPTIQITPTRYYQAIDGFGGTFNEAGWSLLSQLNSSARGAVLAQLFDPTSGAGFSLTRTPMGLDDFSLSQYTYDDLSAGTDFAMSQFSVNHDLQYLIPYIQAAKNHGSFRIFASPWSAPAWMKTNNSLVNDGSVIDPSTDARYYQAYTLYFQKYAQAYAQNNIPIDFVVPQSHWQHHWGDPICPQHRRWQAWQNLSETITLPSGTHAVYLYLPAGSNNLDFFQLN